MFMMSAQELVMYWCVLAANQQEGGLSQEQNAQRQTLQIVTVTLRHRLTS